MRSKTILVGMTVLALLLSPVGDADARKKHKKKNKDNSVPTTLTIDSAEGNTITGDLSAQDGTCVPDRLVRVTRNRVNIGSDTTNENGEWSVNAGAQLAGDETIVAKVDKITLKEQKKNNNKKRNKKKSKKTVCGAASDDFTTSSRATTPAGTVPLAVDVQGGPDDLGTVRSSPVGINCRDANQRDPDPTGAGNNDFDPNTPDDTNPGDCRANFRQDEVVTLTATPDRNEVFSGWGGDCASAGTNPNCQVTMSQARSVTAGFFGCAPTGGALDPILCVVIGLLGG